MCLWSVDMKLMPTIVWSAGERMKGLVRVLVMCNSCLISLVKICSKINYILLPLNFPCSLQSHTVDGVPWLGCFRCIFGYEARDEPHIM